MYKKLTPLKPAEHADLRLLPVTDYSFSRGELLAPIVIDEIADVAREYPIVFPVGSALPVALMGVEKDSNAYVGLDGSWRATYIPAHIRHYPLAIVRVPSQDGESESDPLRFAVLVDEESPFVSRVHGEPIFDGEGKAAGVAQQKMRIMDLMRARAGITQTLVKAIDEAGLLVERAIRIKREGEQDRQVTGIRVINETALNELDDAAFNKLRAAGALPLVYASLLSWANFRQGPIGKSHPLPANPTEMEGDLIRFN